MRKFSTNYKDTCKETCIAITNYIRCCCLNILRREQKMVFLNPDPNGLFSSRVPLDESAGQLKGTYPGRGSYLLNRQHQKERKVVHTLGK